MTQRLMPPGSGLRPAITVNGRAYTCALGSTVDVPDADASVMLANHWVTGTPAAFGGVGATSARPASPYRQQLFLDTTLGYVIVWDDTTWRNPATGASV